VCREKELPFPGTLFTAVVTESELQKYYLLQKGYTTQKTIRQLPLFYAQYSFSVVVL